VLAIARVVNLVAITSSGVNIQFCQLNAESESKFITGARGCAEDV